MESVVTSVRHRIDPAPLTAVVAAGDLAMIAVFVVAGEMSHDVNPVASPLVVADTYVPFLIGWLIAAFLAGAYTTAAWQSIRRAMTVTVPAWIGAALIGQGLRATQLFHGNAALPFVLVSIGVGLALLVPWRVAVALFTDEREGTSH